MSTKAKKQSVTFRMKFTVTGDQLSIAPIEAFLANLVSGNGPQPQAWVEACESAGVEEILGGAEIGWSATAKGVRG